MHTGLTLHQLIKSTAAGAAAVYAIPVFSFGDDMPSRVAIISHVRLINPDESINAKLAKQKVATAFSMLTEKHPGQWAWHG